MGESIATNLYRFGILAAAAFLGWQCISLNMSDYYYERTSLADSATLEQAFAWDSGHPDVLSDLGAQALRAGELDEAEAQLRLAIAANPANARPLMSLAFVVAQQGDLPRSDQMAAIADRLMPVDYAVQRDLAFYALTRNEVDAAVRHLATALVGRRELGETWFPILGQLLGEDERARAAIEPIAHNPAGFPWWPAFFGYVAKEMEDFALLKALMEMRESADAAPLTIGERNAYLRRLRAEGLHTEAYLFWVNALDATGLAQLGYLYDGGFERELGSNAGFSWNTETPETSGFRFSRAAIPGMEGEAALRISFSGTRFRFAHLWQNLLLPPGEYRLTGKLLLDKLRGGAGVQWRVDCLASGRSELGRSAKYFGKSDWREFEMLFVVPNNCAAQRLQLVGGDSLDTEPALRGSVWFDGLQMERLR